MKAVILAAGLGTRLHPLTLTKPKILIPLFNRPLLDYFVDSLTGLCDEIILVVSKAGMSDMIEDYVKTRGFSINIKFVFQPEQRGTGHALQAAHEHIGKNERFVLLYGDDMYSRKDLEELVKHDYALVGKEVTDPEKWGILQQNEQGNLESIIEKPVENVGNLANIGAYVLGGEIFEIFHRTELSTRGEFELTDGVSLFAKEKEVKVLKALGYWLPLGYPWQLIDAQEVLSDMVEYEVEGEIESGATIKGRLKLGKGSLIKSGTYIEGDVVIGENTIIGPNAYIRGITAIGDNCIIGHTTSIKNAIVMNNTKLPFNNYISDGIVGKNVNFDGGCIAANLRHHDDRIKTNIKGKLLDSGRRKLSCIVGDNVKLGVNTIIYPGQKIWPNVNTLPGEIVKTDKLQNDEYDIYF